MRREPEEICPAPAPPPELTTWPLAPALWPASVYACRDPEQAAGILSGQNAGFVYSRDGHPNSAQLADKCRELHGAEEAVLCGSGMAALALAGLVHAAQGDHVLLSSQLYGRSAHLFAAELGRLGVESSTVDVQDLSAVEAACTSRTRLLVVETISNPLLAVADIAGLAEAIRRRGVRLLVDNTFAGPTVCRPIELGADLVMESLTKIMSGHSDVMLGLVCGRTADWGRVALVHSAWGFTPSPFDCWLCLRGLSTLALRGERAGANAQRAAEYLQTRPEVERVYYPGLADHRQHELAARQFNGRFGSVTTFSLRGGLEAARRFIAAARRIPFCPSLGDVSTTLSHPQSTSHRAQTEEQRLALGITGGMIRLSVGIESPEAVCDALAEGLAALT